MKSLNFISTCSLCLELCINQELKKYNGLKSYFQSENFADERFKHFQAVLNNPMTAIYLYFYQAVLPCFTNFNKLFQHKEPLIYKLHEAQQHFMSKLASRFIKSLSIQDQKLSNSSLATLDIDIKNQKDNINLGIGIITCNILKRLFNNGDIVQNDADCFFNGVHDFFVKAFNYCIKLLLLDDSFIKNLVFIDFEKRNNINFESIQVIQSFNIINNKLIKDPSLLNTVEEEFIDYQTLTKDDIPSSIWEVAKLSDNSNRIDVTWGYLKSRSPHIGEVAESVSVMSHSNASEERVFSIIQKIRLNFDIV